MCSFLPLEKTAVKIMATKSNERCMTKTEFIEKAKKLGYTIGWIENAINKMNELNNKYGFHYSYEDIVVRKLKKGQENILNKFAWKSNDTIIFKSKKV